MATVVRNEEPLQRVEWQPLILHLEPIVELEDDQFFELCQIKPRLGIERNAQGALLIMLPTGGKTSEHNAKITMQLSLWGERDGTGVSYDSSGGFLLPNKAVRSPDALG
jgi:Uma2 family endonuclease